MNILRPLLLAAACLTASAIFISAAHASPPMPPNLADLAAKLLPTVVSVASTAPVADNPNQPADPNDPNSAPNTGPDQGKATGTLKPNNAADPTSGSVLPPPKAEEALGSGFVIDPAGFILTNDHVIDGATSVTVTFQDGTILPASVVGVDKDGDLAVLKVDAGHKLPAVTFGDSTKLRVGDWVLAIGNPFGLAGSTSAGIVSALHRDISEGKYDDFIQTDATINRGNSGGPLFNAQGQVIGVNSAIYSPSGGSIGIGFAIPSAMVQPIAASLEANGFVQRGWLGVSTENVTPEIQKLLDLPGTDGALIAGVTANSPASGKLQPGDVLTSLNNAPITDTRSLLIRTAEIPAGQVAHAQFYRGGNLQSADLIIAVPPPQPAPGTITPAAAANITLTSIGVSIAANSSQDGAHILSVTANGPAAKAGIVAADVVEAVGATTVNSAADLKEALAKLTSAHQQTATLLIDGDDATGTDPGPRWVAVVAQ
ncbi:MAG: trypsin-like peptidase domain-containing protein [Acidocella sp.]|nr:trypsin-like peptidase domain-containing protein [Acidocella sp.]